MKKLIAIAFLSLPFAAATEHMDVIQMELNADCSVSEFMQIVSDFNEFASDWGYNAKVAVPLQAENLVTIFWLGTSADAATFGKAWDNWRDAQSDANSDEAKLQARFSACATNTARRSYDVY